MQIRAILPTELEAARKLLQAAVEGDEVIDFVRALSDGIFNGYRSMIPGDR